MSIHSQNEQVILEFGLKKPAFRIVVNTPTTHGSIGLTTGLDPAMTLGCGGYGGNITSDNISPRHLLNIKRLAYELIPAMRSEMRDSVPAVAAGRAPAIAATGITAEALSKRIDAFLGSRGFKPEGDGRLTPVPSSSSLPSASSTGAAPLQFVCEDDVRTAIRVGQKLVVSERAIITPAARDLGEQHRIFTVAPWRG
jgi:acetaldehyde dehydrogenase (acetylating)